MRRVRSVVMSVASVILGLVLVSGCVGEADPPSAAPTAEPGPELPEVAPPLGVEDLDAFSGVVMLGAGSNCTGTVIDTGVPAGPAYVLTNGHCVGEVGLSAQGTRHHVEWFGDAVFFRTADNLQGTVTVAVEELAYSTMRLTDTAIVRLDRTLADLIALGVRPVPVAGAEPAPGAEVVNIGVPVQDLPEDEWVLRRGECTLAEQHTLIEFTWLWHGVWSNDCPGIIQGSSGSPLFAVDEDGIPTAVVAMINTTTAGADSDRGGWCFMNRPCELGPEGARMKDDTGYAQSVAGVGSCFEAGTGQFALGPDCPLPTSSIWSTMGGGSFRGADAPDSVGRTPGATLVGRAAGTARTALAPIGDGTACADPATYATAAEQDLPEASEEWSAAGLEAAVPLPEEEGWYLLCAVRGDDLAGAASVLFEVDRTPPVLPAGATVEDLEGAKLIRPVMDPPELAMIRYTWGSPDDVDCEDTAAFSEFRMIPLVLEPDDLPAVYCVFAEDNAGNPTPVTRIEID